MADKFTFLNRDLSWLCFNERVLEEAADPTVPLPDRFRFLSIYSSNLDEFYRVRMPVIKSLSVLKSKKISIQDEYPNDLIVAVQQKVQGQLERFGEILTTLLLPELKKYELQLCYNEPVPVTVKEAVALYFNTYIAGYIRPVRLDSKKKEAVFPENNALYFVVQTGDETEDVFYLLNIPSGHLPRFRRFDSAGAQPVILFLDDMIRESLPVLFPGMHIRGAWSIKLTRNAELNLEDEFSGDIAEKIEKQLEKRDKGAMTRLLVDAAAPDAVVEFIRQYFDSGGNEIVPGGRYHHLRDLAELPIKDIPIHNPSDWKPVMHPGFSPFKPVVESIHEGEKLLHFPYHSYDPVLRFFSEAAVDPKVKAIAVTLYRVAPDSQIVHALMTAAANGKEVVVFVELKARFDEANNLKWSKRMKAAGVRIIQSLPGLKVHAKVALLQREENGRIRHYAYLGTGNFNESTARFYTDHGFFTADKKTGEELQLLFQFLQSKKQPDAYSPVPVFSTLLVSQFNLIRAFDKLIQAEMLRARRGEPAFITVKLNNLQERGMIRLLYEASNAGVKIKLLVRGICCLEPGIPGQSENISVTRIVDRYLEHARVFVFHNGGDTLYFLGSADWMNRNLFNRIEVCFPVKQQQLKDELNRILTYQLNDNVKAVQLKPAYESTPVRNTNEPCEAQQEIHKWITGMDQDTSA